MKNMPNIEQGLKGLRIAGPDAPELTPVLARFVNVGQARCMPSALVLALRVLTLLLICGLVYGAVQVIGTRPGAAMATLTPLRVVNEAWSAADGYVLEFEVF